MTDPVPRHLWNPRRAYTREGHEIPPATVGTNLAEGRTTAWICCNACQHDVTVGIEGLPLGWALPDLALRLRLTCSRCGSKSIAATLDIVPIYARERGYRRDQPVEMPTGRQVVPWQDLVGPERAEAIHAEATPSEA